MGVVEESECEVTGSFKSEPSAEWRRSNQQKIEAAVESVKKYHTALLSEYDHWDNPDIQRANFRRMIEGMRTLIDSWDWLHSHYHHFQKYHAADQDAFMGGYCYLGTGCVECEFSRSQQRAIDEHVAGALG